MTTKKITTMALFAAISIIATRFLSFMIPLGGFPSLSIGIGGIPIMLSGILFGPVSGAIVGGVSDIIGFLINDRGGIYHVGFTINSILTGLIPGLVVWMLKRYPVQQKVIAILNYALLFLATAVGMYYLATNQHLGQKVWVSYLLMGILVVIWIILIVMMRRFQKKEVLKKQLNILILCVLLVELLVYVGLTPIWIAQLYGIPSIISIISRVLRMVFLIPIKVALLLAILKVSAKSKELL